VTSNILSGRSIHQQQIPKQQYEATTNTNTSILNILHWLISSICTCHEYAIGIISAAIHKISMAKRARAAAKSGGGDESVNTESTAPRRFSRRAANKVEGKVLSTKVADYMNELSDHTAAITAANNNNTNTSPINAEVEEGNTGTLPPITDDNVTNLNPPENPVQPHVEEPTSADSAPAAAAPTDTPVDADFSPPTDTESSKSPPKSQTETSGLPSGDDFDMNANNKDPILPPPPQLPPRESHLEKYVEEFFLNSNPGLKTTGDEIILDSDKDMNGGEFVELTQVYLAKITEACRRGEDGKEAVLASVLGIGDLVMAYTNQNRKQSVRDEVVEDLVKSMSKVFITDKINGPNAHYLNQW
jgi:hypothetical protein